MRRFVYETNGKNGLVETFFLPQTPQEFASRVSRRVSSPKFMDGVKHFSILVWAVPEGAIHVDDVPRSSPARATYIQCGGPTRAMTIEIRITHEDGSYEQYAVAREPVTDPETWTTVSWDNRGPEPFTIKAPSAWPALRVRGQSGQDHHDHPRRGGLPSRSRHRGTRHRRRAPACSRLPT